MKSTKAIAGLTVSLAIAAPAAAQPFQHLPKKRQAPAGSTQRHELTRRDPGLRAASGAVDAFNRRHYHPRRDGMILSYEDVTIEGCERIAPEHFTCALSLGKWIHTDNPHYRVYVSSDWTDSAVRTSRGWRVRELD
jgi:hypothetical protein